MPASPQANRTAATVPPTRGSVELICGCMFSGKTTTLLTELSRFPPESVLLVKHTKDDRDSHDTIATHDGKRRQAVSVAASVEIPRHVTDTIEVVAIDEGHFFDNQLADVCDALADSGMRVIVTALDRDMWGLPFATIQRLAQRATVVRIQKGVCAVCGQPATRTHRLTPIIGRNLVGGRVDFEPRCQQHFSPPPERRISPSEMT